MITTLYRKLLFKTLKNIKQGCLIIKENEHEYMFGDEHSADQVTLLVVQSDFYSTICLGGSLGAGDAYVQGYWETDDLSKLMILFMKNQHLFDFLDYGITKWLKNTFTRVMN